MCEICDISRAFASIDDVIYIYIYIQHIENLERIKCDQQVPCVRICNLSLPLSLTIFLALLAEFAPSAEYVSFAKEGERLSLELKSSSSVSGCYITLTQIYVYIYVKILFYYMSMEDIYVYKLYTQRGRVTCQQLSGQLLVWGGVSTWRGLTCTWSNLRNCGFLSYTIRRLTTYYNWHARKRPSINASLINDVDQISHLTNQKYSMFLQTERNFMAKCIKFREKKYHFRE